MPVKVERGMKYLGEAVSANVPELRGEPAKFLSASVSTAPALLSVMATITANGSTSSPHKHKKRKERPSDSHLIEESHHHKKKKKSKDKHRHAELEVPPLEVNGHHASKGKGKRKMEDDASAFVVVSASTRLSIPPVFASKPLAGVEEMLDSMVMKYVLDPSLCSRAPSAHMDWFGVKARTFSQGRRPVTLEYTVSQRRGANPERMPV